jgi:hypothetical protein
MDMIMGCGHDYEPEPKTRAVSFAEASVRAEARITYESEPFFAVEMHYTKFTQTLHGTKCTVILKKSADGTTPNVMTSSKKSRI